MAKFLTEDEVRDNDKIALGFNEKRRWYSTRNWAINNI